MPVRDILCLGEPLVEFSQIRGTEWRQGFGGDVSNVAVAAARQGARAGMATRLGTDSFGDMLVQLWQAEGVDCAAVHRDGAAPTGLYFIRHGAQGHRFEYRRAGSAAARMGPGDLPRAEIAASAVLHLSGITQAISASSRAAALEAMRLARAAGRQVSFDPNLRLALWPLEEARAAFEAALPLCDILLPGLEDARALTGLERPEEIAERLLEAGPRLVALTLGAEGVLLAERGGALQRIPGLAVEAVDASGAGDCFDGAFLARLAAGDDPARAARYAAAAASLSTRGYGAVAPIPRAEEVRAALAAG